MTFLDESVLDESIATQPQLTWELTLEQFLEQPETEPASEFVSGRMIQKPMPQGEHSALQEELVSAINQVAKSTKVARAFPELRCTFGGSSIVPDIAVFRWANIPTTAAGKIANRFLIPPDWAIEILSPGQSWTQVLEKLLHCVEHGTELGWLLDPRADRILAVFPGQRVQMLTGETNLPVLKDIPLELTVKQVFDWLLV